MVLFIFNIWVFNRSNSMKKKNNENLRNKKYVCFTRTHAQILKTFVFYLLVACAHSYYGPDCNLTCSISCFNQTCDAKSGECLKVIFFKSVILVF